MTAAIMDALAEHLCAIEVHGHNRLLEGEAVIYVVHVGAVDDRTIIRLMERFAAVRRQYEGRRCFAVLVAEHVGERYRKLLRVIGRAVPIIPLEVRESAGALGFREIELS